MSFKVNLEKFIKDYEKALGSQSWSKVEPLIADAATVTFSNGDTYHGKSKIKAAFENNFAIIKNEKYTMENIRWLFNDDAVGVYTFDFKWKGIIKGTHTEGAGRGTSVIINEKGIWKLLTEHLGPMPKDAKNQ